jgi:hypothetical protein
MDFLAIFESSDGVPPLRRHLPAGMYTRHFAPRLRQIRRG